MTLISSIGRTMCVAILFAILPASLWAQTSDVAGLEIIRAFVEEKDVDRVVTPAFLEVRSNELDKLLKDYVQRRSLATVEDTGIQRATYVARWNEQMLLSRASLIPGGHGGGRAPITLGEFLWRLRNRRAYQSKPYP